MSSKKLWKNVPRQDSKSISKPPLPTPNIKSTTNTSTHHTQSLNPPNGQSIDASQLKIKESSKIEDRNNLDLEETARFASSQVGEFVKSDKFQNILKQILSSNLSHKNENCDIEKDEKLVWSVDVGKNLMLSIGSKESFKSRKSLKRVIKQQLREFREYLHYMREYATILNSQMNQWKNIILKEFQKIQQSLRFKNKASAQTIKELEEKVQRQKQVSNQMLIDRSSINKQLEAIMNEFENTQEKVIKLKSQIRDKSQENQNLKSQIIALTQENEKMQEQTFEYRQRLSQLDLEISKRIQQAIKNHHLPEQESVNRHQRVKHKRSIQGHKKKLYQSSEYYIDKYQSQETVGMPSKFNTVNHRQRYNNSYEANLNEEASCDNYKKYPHSCVSGEKKQDHYKTHWSPRNEETTRKLNNMHQRIFGKASSLKQNSISKKQANTSKSPNHLASLQSKLSALKGQIERELRDAK